MQDSTLQLTIRGLNKTTKEALQQRAGQQGISLNKYALRTLQQRANISSNEERYHELKQFLNKHSMDGANKQAFNDALAWSDKVSKKKQAKDDLNI